MTPAIRVVIHDDHEIFRRGLQASLRDHDDIDVVSVEPRSAPHDAVDVVVASVDVAQGHAFPCPLVLCVDGSGVPPGLTEGHTIAGVLDRATMTPDHLGLAIRAAAAGRQVNPDAFTPATNGPLEPRAIRVLELLADGRTTREIAEELSYSERTIKKHIQDLEHRLGARSRAHAVAEAIRQGLI